MLISWTTCILWASCFGIGLPLDYCTNGWLGALLDPMSVQQQSGLKIKIFEYNASIWRNRIKSGKH